MRYLNGLKYLGSRSDMLAPTVSVNISNIAIPSSDTFQFSFPREQLSPNATEKASSLGNLPNRMAKCLNRMVSLKHVS